MNRVIGISYTKYMQNQVILPLCDQLWQFMQSDYMQLEWEILSWQEIHKQFFCCKCVKPKKFQQTATSHRDLHSLQG